MSKHFAIRDMKPRRAAWGSSVREGYLPNRQREIVRLAQKQRTLVYEKKLPKDVERLVALGYLQLLSPLTVALTEKGMAFDPDKETVRQRAIQYHVGDDDTRRKVQESLASVASQVHMNTPEMLRRLASGDLIPIQADVACLLVDVFMKNVPPSLSKDDLKEVKQWLRAVTT